MREFTKIAASFIFIALMAFKVSAVHIYSHHDTDADEIENCTSCELAVQQQLTSFTHTVTISLPTAVLEAIETTVNTSTVVVVQEYAGYGFFSRPPPTSI